MVIGILAHVDAGKTTLSEAILYRSGAIRKLGRVDHQDAFLDTDAMERERGITIFSKQARFQLKEETVTLLDTPGHVDFSAEMERTLQVLDYAILVISGSEGVQGHTRTLWRLLLHYQVPTFIFVNKMDLPQADATLRLAELKKELSENCVCITETEDFDMEEVATCSEELLEAYLERGSLLDSEIAKAIAERTLFPVIFGAALKEEGVLQLLSCLHRFRRKIPDTTAVSSEASSLGDGTKEFAARVYKIGRGEREERLTFLKVIAGTLRVRQPISYDEVEEKIAQIRLYSGEKYETTECAKAGEVCAVVGLSATYPGQGLGAEEATITSVLEPVLNYRMILPSEVNAAEFFKKLKVLEEEDPKLSLVWKEELKEIHVQLMGQVQMEILTREIKDRLGVVVLFGPGRIIYKETLVEPVEGVGHFEPLRHYAEVYLRLEPAPRGNGVTVHSECSEDLLAKNWQRLIATHVLEREHKGVLTGSGLVDVNIAILAGRAHTKHTMGGDFRQATYRAIRQGLKSGQSKLLEPYYSYVLGVPMEDVGRAMTDIKQRFGNVEKGPAFETVGDVSMAILEGKAPVSTMQDYVNEVHAYTKGRGYLYLDLCGYEDCHNPKEVIEERGYDSEADLRNPTGSVFCAHGAGFVVPWNEVWSYMHVEAEAEGTLTDVSGVSGIEMTQTGSGGGSFIQRVSKMTEDEISASLSDIYRREFKMTEEERRENERKKWANKKQEAKPVAHVKYDKKGNPLYPKKEAKQEYLLVDGYNIIFAWEELKALSNVNIDSARDALKDMLSNYQGYCGHPVMLVFDAYKVKGNQGKTEVYNGNLQVVYTKQDETADMYMERMVHEQSQRYHFRVASGDGLVQQTVLAMGGLRMSASELKLRIEQCNKVASEGFSI